MNFIPVTEVPWKVKLSKFTKSVIQAGISPLILAFLKILLEMNMDIPINVEIFQGNVAADRVRDNSLERVVPDSNVVKIRKIADFNWDVST
jgi:hypothetical protein